MGKSHHGPLGTKARWWLSFLSGGGQGLSGACLLFCPPTPPTAGPVLSSHRQPSEGHPFMTLSAPGTRPSLPDSSATSSAARRLTQLSRAQLGPCGRMCVSFLILPVCPSSFMGSHSSPAHHVFCTPHPLLSLPPGY